MSKGEFLIKLTMFSIILFFLGAWCGGCVINDEWIEMCKSRKEYQINQYIFKCEPVKGIDL